MENKADEDVVGNGNKKTNSHDPTDLTKDDGASNSGESESSGFTAVLIIIFFGAFLLAMLTGFLNELSENGLASAIERKPAILVVLGIVVSVFVVGSKERLEEVGLGGFRKVFVWLLVVALVGFIVFVFFERFGGFGGQGVPDNVRM